LPDGSQIELFSFPNPPQRTSRSEAQGLSHLAFVVTNVDQYTEYLNVKGVISEPIRIDEYTNKKFTFFSDPDGLSLEVYEQ
jgi:glyoxylase I family protein